MAKVLNPLFSTEARGQVGKSLVFFPWKGISAVRTYVVPANPKTASQQGVRGRLKEAVLRWRTLGYTASDRAAYNAWALLEVKSMSGFNKLVSLVLQAKAKQLGFVYPYDLKLASLAGGQLTIEVAVYQDVSDYTVTAYIDTKQGGTFISMTLAWNTTNYAYEGTREGLTSGATYWVRIKVEKAGKRGEIGDGKLKVT